MRISMKSIEPGVVTVAEAAKFLECHPKTVRTLCREGTIHAIKLGTEWRIPVEALEEMLAKGSKTSK